MSMPKDVSMPNDHEYNIDLDETPLNHKREQI